MRVNVACHCAHILPHFCHLWRVVSAGLGSALASSTAAVEACASGSVTHQSCSLSKPTADRTPQVPRSLFSATHTLKSLTKHWCHYIWQDVTAELPRLSSSVLTYNPSYIKWGHPHARLSTARVHVCYDYSGTEFLSELSGKGKRKESKWLKWMSINTWTCLCSTSAGFV